MNVLMVLVLGMTPVFVSVYFERKLLLEGVSLDTAHFSFDDLMLTMWLTIIIVLALTYLVLSTALVTLDGLAATILFTAIMMTVIEGPRCKQFIYRILSRKKQ